MKPLLLLACLVPHASYAASYAAVVMEPSSGVIVDGISHTRSVYPASLTKMMTLFLLFEALQRKKVTLQTRFVVSPNASHQPPSKLGVRAGQTISVRECILSLAVRSANDIAMVVAENLGGGSSQTFVKNMNMTAQKLGLYRTRFCNPSGLHHPHQYTTAADMARLTRALWKCFPQYTYFLGLPYFIRNKICYRNTNKLHGKVLGIKIGKTGYTRPAGWNLAMLTVRNRAPLVVVVMGMPSAQERDAHMARLIHTFYTIPHKLSTFLRKPKL